MLLRSRSSYRVSSLPLLRLGQRSAALDQQITLHLLVQRRAEVGAVVREDSGFVGHELYRLGLARIDHHVDVVFAEAEAMQFIGRLFYIRDVNGHGVALIDLNLVRLERAPHSHHLDRDIRAVARDAGVLHVPDGVRILVLFFLVDLEGFELVHLDHLGVMRLRLGEGFVKHLHLLAADVDQLRAFGLRRADVQMASVRELVQSDDVFAVGIDRVAFGRAEVADVVSHRNLVNQFPRAEFPLGDGALDEEAGVGVALIVELRVERAQAHVDLGVFDLVVVQDRDAVLIACEVFVMNGGHHLLEVERRRDRLQLAAADDVFAVGADVDAVRRLAAGDQINNPGRLLRINHLDAADRLEFAFVDSLLGLFPVDGGDVVAVFLRRGDFEFACGALGGVAGPEGPPPARPRPRVAQVPVERGLADLEAYAHPARLRIDLHARNDSVVFRRVLLDRRVRAFRQRYREARRGQYVFGVRRHERPAVKAGYVRNRP